MILKKIILKDFKCYSGEHIFEFDKITQVSGGNGCGKSSLIKDSLKFCLYGDSNVKLSELPTRGIATKCQVSVAFELDGVDYLVTRWYPSKLEIFKNDEMIEFGNNTQKQQFIDSLLGNVDVFKKFRLIDFRDGINILEGSELAIKKTMFTLDDDVINAVRKALLDVISERKQGNRDVYRANSHYPSTKRLSCLKQAINEVKTEISRAEEIESKSHQLLSDFRTQLYAAQSSKSLAVKQINDFSVAKTCSYCGQDIKIDVSNKIELANANIIKYNELITKYQKLISEISDILAGDKDRLASHRAHHDRLLKRITNLETAIKQSNLKYSNKDVLEAEEALKEFDKFGSFYIQSQLNDIEPIINDICGLIDLQVKFNISDKGKLDIKIIRDSNEYNYQELSEGQKMIVGVAFKLALLMKESKTGVVCADEGMSCLDDDNFNKLIELFNGLPFQLIFVAHGNRKCHNVNIIALGD